MKKGKKRSIPRKSKDRGGRLLLSKIIDGHDVKKKKKKERKQEKKKKKREKKKNTRRQVAMCKMGRKGVEHYYSSATFPWLARGSEYNLAYDNEREH